MVYTEEKTFKLAYVELYEVLKRLSEDQKEKLPPNFTELIQEKMDKDYTFEYDDSIGLEEQNFMTETKALIVQIYSRYLCSEEEKPTWEKYHRICLNKIEEKKAEQYNANDLFKNKKQVVEEEIEENQDLPAVVQKEGIGQKIINFIKRIFHR